MGKDINSILNTCFLSTAENIMREKKNGQVLNKAPFCKSKQIYIYILLDGLAGSGMGFFFLASP